MAAFVHNPVNSGVAALMQRYGWVRVPRPAKGGMSGFVYYKSPDGRQAQHFKSDGTLPYGVTLETLERSLRRENPSFSDAAKALLRTHGYKQDHSSYNTIFRKGDRQVNLKPGGAPEWVAGNKGDSPLPVKGSGLESLQGYLEGHNPRLSPLPEDAPLDRRIARLEIMTLRAFPGSPTQKELRSEYVRLRALRGSPQDVAYVRHAEEKRNPLFLPKSLFDSYTVRSQGGEVSVDRIQTLSGAEKKVKELAKRYPCVGFDIRSKKFDSVVKSYKAAVGGAPKVDEDNTRSYKREATEAAKANAQFRLDLDGREYGTYDTKKEAQEVGKREGGRVRIKEVVANPYSPSGHSHLSDAEYSDMMHEFHKQIPDPPRPLVKRYGINYRNQPDIKEIESADRKVTSTRSRMLREYKEMVEESNRRFHARGKDDMRNPRGYMGAKYAPLPIEYQATLNKPFAGNVTWQMRTEEGDSVYKRDFSAVRGDFETYMRQQFGAAFANKVIKALVKDGNVSVRNNPSKRVVHLFRIHILSNSDNHGMGSANVYTGKGIMDKDGVVASPSWYMGPQSIAVGGPMGVDYTRERMAKKHYHEVDEGGGRVKNPSDDRDFLAGAAWIDGLVKSGKIDSEPVNPVKAGKAYGKKIGGIYQHLHADRFETGARSAYRTYIQMLENPLTGQPSHDIPELRRSGRSQRQSVAIAMSEQRRLNNPSNRWTLEVKSGRRNPALTGYSVVQSGSVASTIRKTGISNKGTAMEFAKRVSVQVPHLDVFVVKGGEPIAAFKSGKLIKRNPDDSFAASESAEALYESFHGVPPTGEIVYEENHEVPDAYAELGDLVELKVATIHGKDATIAAPDPDSGDLQAVVKLASDPTGKQLYFIGGDQELDLDKMGFAESEERHRMLIGVVYELTYRAKKKFHNLKLTDYYHALGEETGNQPCLTYNPYSCSLGLVGGNYEVRPEGIVD